MVRSLDSRLDKLEVISPSIDEIEFVWIDGDDDGTTDDYEVVLKWCDDDGSRGDLWQDQ